MQLKSLRGGNETNQSSFVMPFVPCAMTTREPGDGTGPIPALQRKPHPKATDAMRFRCAICRELAKRRA